LVKKTLPFLEYTFTLKSILSYRKKWDNLVSSSIEIVNLQVVY